MIVELKKEEQSTIFGGGWRIVVRPDGTREFIFENK